MYTVETTLENEYLDNLDALSVEKTDRVKKIESLENRIAHELYMIKTLDERMSKMSEKYRKDIENTVAAALAMYGDSMKGSIRFWLGFLVGRGAGGTVEVTPVLKVSQILFYSVAIIIGTIVMWSGANALSKV